MFKHRLCCLMVFLLGCFSLNAGVYNPNNIPIPKNSTHPSYISNPDGILPDSVCSVINHRLFQLEDSVGVKSLVIVVEHIEGDDPYAFSLNVGNKYGVGSKKDNKGLVITLATLDRLYYILTGMGLEAELPDAVCHKIGKKVMVPHLKNGEWSQAVDSTVQELCRVIYREEAAMVKYGVGETSSGQSWSFKTDFEENFWIWMLLFFVLRIVVNYAILYFVDYREYQLYLPKLLRWLATFIWIFIWNPGFSLYYEPKKKQRVYYVDNRGITDTKGSGGGGYSGSSSRSSSGSRSYGSTGGGRFGGGGAGGRF